MKLNWVATAALSLAVIAPGLALSEVAEPPVLQGAVKQQLVLDEVLLKSLPATTVDVNYETGEGKKSASYTGVLLWALLVKSGPIDGSGKNAQLRHTLLITGRDGYGAAVALGELDPHYEGKSVILAYAGGDPAASFSALRLVVPGDAHGGRSVRDVSSIELRQTGSGSLPNDVYLGSLADASARIGDVRFTPNSGQAERRG